MAVETAGGVRLSFLRKTSDSFKRHSSYHEAIVTTRTLQNGTTFRKRPIDDEQ